MSSNGWDVAGATWFGYTTFWINRRALPAEELGVTPRGAGAAWPICSLSSKAAAPGTSTRQPTEHSKRMPHSPTS